MIQTRSQDSTGNVLPHTGDLSPSYPATTTTDLPSQPRRPLQDVCVELRDRLDAFLAEDVDAALLKDVQAQLRISMAVVEEALGTYE
jgi:FAD synthetase